MKKKRMEFNALPDGMEIKGLKKLIIGKNILIEVMGDKGTIKVSYIYWWDVIKSWFNKK